MIISILDLQDRHESYNRNNLSFDYMTPEQFGESIGKVELYGEINLQKPYNGDYSNKAEWKRFDLVAIPDKKDKYLRYFELKRAKKSHKNKAIGYVAVNIQGTIRYIRIIDGEGILLPLLLLFGTVALVGLLAVPRFQNTGTQIVETQPTLEMAEGKEWDGTLPERYQEEIDYQENIEIAGYTNLLVTADHQQIDLINTESNTVYQQYLILQDGKEIFDSKLIAPGKMVAWNAYEALGAGHYQLDFKVNTYDLETQAPCNGTTQSVSLDVKKNE